MKLLLTIILLSLETIIARDCFYGNYTYKKGSDDPRTFTPYICSDVHSRCIKVETEENDVVYSLRTCGARKACNMEAEMDISEGMGYPGSGRIYCCDRNSCNRGSPSNMPRMSSQLFLLLAFFLQCYLKQ